MRVLYKVGTYSMQLLCGRDMNVPSELLAWVDDPGGC